MTRAVVPLVAAIVAAAALAAGAGCNRDESSESPAAVSAAATLASAPEPAPEPAPASAAVAASAPAAASSSTPTPTPTPASAPAPTCGNKPLAPCPLYAWMKANTSPAMSAEDFDALAVALEKVATFAPPAYANWASISNDGASAARVQNLDAVKAACRGCHTQYKDRYKREMRGRPI